MTPEVVTIDLGHLRVAALAWGDPNGRLALCLHGYPDTAWTWRHLGPVLAAHGFRVVAPFSRGYAPTEIPADGDYHIGALMYDAIALHDRLGGGDDTVVIGHDWGGFTAVALAAHPDSPFGSVVALATPVLFGFGRGLDRDGYKRLPSQVRKSWYVLFQQLPVIPERLIERTVARLWRDWSPPSYDAAADVERLWTALPDRAHRTAALTYYRHQFQPRPIAARYRGLHSAWRSAAPVTPMLLVHGGRDGGLDVDLATFTASCLPKGSTHQVISGAGHFPHLDHVEETNELIIDHLRH